MNSLLASLASDPVVPFGIFPNHYAAPAAKASDNDLQLMMQHPERELRYVARAPDLTLDIQKWFATTYGGRPFSQKGSQELELNYCVLAYHLQRSQVCKEGVYDILRSFINTVSTCVQVAVQTQDRDLRLKDTSSMAGLDMSLNVCPAPGQYATVPFINMNFKFSDGSATEPGQLDKLDGLLSSQPRFTFPKFEIAHKEIYMELTGEATQFPQVPDLPAHIQSTYLRDGQQSVAALNLLPLLRDRDSWPEGDFDGKGEEWEIFCQAWIQMEKYDLTLAVLMDTRRAFYLIRHRASRTLCVSPANGFKCPSSPGTISEWTSLLCMAFVDWQERALAINAGKGPAIINHIPADHGSGMQSAVHKSDRTSTGQNLDKASMPSSHDIIVTPCSSANGLRGAARLEEEKCKPRMGRDHGAGSGQVMPPRMVHEHLLPQSNELIYLSTQGFPKEILMILRTPGYISSRFAIVLHGCPTTSPSFGPISTLPPSGSESSTLRSDGSSDDHCSESTTLHDDDSLTRVPGLLILLSRIAESQLNTVWRGYLDLGQQGAIAIIAKIGPYNDLEREKCIYERLEKCSVRGVPTFLGLYRDSIDGQSLSKGYLVLTDEGDRIGQGALTDAESEVFIDIVDQIHGAGVILWSLGTEHLLKLKSSLGAVTLAMVDFSKADLFDQEEQDVAETQEYYAEEKGYFMGVLAELRQGYSIAAHMAASSSV